MNPYIAYLILFVLCGQLVRSQQELDGFPHTVVLLCSTAPLHCSEGASLLKMCFLSCNTTKKSLTASIFMNKHSEHVQIFWRENKILGGQSERRGYFSTNFLETRACMAVKEKTPTKCLEESSEEMGELMYLPRVVCVNFSTCKQVILCLKTEGNTWRNPLP